MSVTDPAHLVVTDPTHLVISDTTPIISPQHWSQRSGVMASPTMTPVQQTPQDLLLNTVNQEEMGKNLPPFNHHVINCPCSSDCEDECCCRMRRRRRSDSLEADASTRLLSERTNGDDRWSVSSYGSTDSNDNLIHRDEDMVGLSVSLSV